MIKDRGEVVHGSWQRTGGRLQNLNGSTVNATIEENLNSAPTCQLNIGDGINTKTNELLKKHYLRKRI